jgi:hypothetical protein
MGRTPARRLRSNFGAGSLFSDRLQRQSLVDPFPIVRIAIIELLFVSPGWPRNALLPPDVA